VSDEIAGRMIERFPDSEYVTAAWEGMASRHEPIGEMLKQVGCPLLLAKHEGCISFTEEGFDDAVAAFPDARVTRVPGAPGTREEFAHALREFCAEVDSAERGSRLA
jgi:hypothetical protein